MFNFHGKEIKLKVLRRLTEWIHKSAKDVSILSFIHKVEVGSNLDPPHQKMIYPWFKKMYLNNQRGKSFLKLFWVLILQISGGKSNIFVNES